MLRVKTNGKDTALRAPLINRHFAQCRESFNLYIFDSFINASHPTRPHFIYCIAGLSIGDLGYHRLAVISCGHANTPARSGTGYLLLFNATCTPTETPGSAAQHLSAGAEFTGIFASTPKSAL